MYIVQPSEKGYFSTLQRQNAGNLKQIFPEKDYWGLSPNFHIHVSVSELYTVFPRWVCLFCWRKYVDRSWEYIVEIGAEAALFPENKYINGIAVAVYIQLCNIHNIGKQLCLVN
jgi:hypothetical protein